MQEQRKRYYCGQIWGIRPYGKRQSDGHFQPKTTLSLRRKAKLHAEGASPFRLWKTSLAEGEFHCSTAEAVEPYASLREGGGPRSGGRSPRVQKQRKRHCSGRIWNPLLRRIAKRREEQAPPLPLSKISALPNLPKTFFSLRRQAKHHAEGASLSACGKHHSPKANIPVQPPHGDCTMGDREAVEGAGGYESNDLPCMRCLPLFSLVEAEVSSLLYAFSFRHPCGAGRWGEATAPCSHP